MTESDLKRTEELKMRTEEIMGEIRSRLNILNGIAVILEKYSDSADSKLVLDEIRSISSWGWQRSAILGLRAGASCNRA